MPCGDMMRLETREVISQVPGTNQQLCTIVREWVCRERDYFEEAEDLGGAEKEERGRSHSARADRQQNFFAECVFDLLEIEGCLALVAQHFEHRRPALFCDLDTAVIELHDVQLHRLDLKILRVPAIRARKRHASSSSLLRSARPGRAAPNAQKMRHRRRPRNSLYWMPRAKRNELFWRSFYRLSRSDPLNPRPSTLPSSCCW
jgi:hypothetical protein